MKTSIPKAIPVLLSLLLTHSLYAKAEFYIMGGSDRTLFKSTESMPITSYSYSLGFEWSLWHNLSLSLEYRSTPRGGILEDKIIGGYYAGDAYSQDIHCLLRSFELPILLRYSVPIRDKLSVQLLAGPALSLGRKDKSTFNNKEYLFKVTNPEEWDHLFYDYEHVYEQSGPLPYEAETSGIVLYTGVALKWYIFKAEFRYAYDFFNLEAIKATKIDEKSHSLSIQVGINIAFHLPKQEPQKVGKWTLP